MDEDYNRAIESVQHLEKTLRWKQKDAPPKEDGQKETGPLSIRVERYSQ
jgi:hypothetical protein